MIVSVFTKHNDGSVTEEMHQITYDTTFGFPNTHQSQKRTFLDVVAAFRSGVLENTTVDKRYFKTETNKALTVEEFFSVNVIQDKDGLFCLENIKIDTKFYNFEDAKNYYRTFFGYPERFFVDKSHNLRIVVYKDSIDFTSKGYELTFKRDKNMLRDKIQQWLDVDKTRKTHHITIVFQYYDPEIHDILNNLNINTESESIQPENLNPYALIDLKNREVVNIYKDKGACDCERKAKGAGFECYMTFRQANKLADERAANVLKGLKKYVENHLDKM